MALLQISEPGRSAAPHQHRLAVGIDLGTTNSLVAGTRSGTTVVLRDENGAALLPSAVRFAPQEGRTLVGRAALAGQDAHPGQTLTSVKRLMGRSLVDVAQLGPAPYRLLDHPGGIAIETCAGSKTPVEVSAEILRSLRERAESNLGGELTGAVITVPAYFDDAQRQATRDAARLAGLNVMRLLNEPTAAAIAYGLDRRAEGVFAVYDLGGGTFDFSLLRLARGVFEVLATGRDSVLGGDDFDARVLAWLLEQVADPARLGAVSMQRLRTLARDAKEALSEAGSTPIRIDLPDCGSLSAVLTREDFGQRTADLVARTLAVSGRALADAGLPAGQIDGVVLVGGSTRMPCIRSAVREYFGREPLTDLDPDQVVALGAALQADLLCGNERAENWLLLDVCPLSLGLETMGGLVERIIPRNSTLPVARVQDFTTFRDGQTAMSLHVVQGERELVADCRSLARFDLRGIPPMVAGAARIRVTFQVDADGLLSVSAQEQSSGVRAAVDVRPSYGLDDDQITRMLEASFAQADADVLVRRLREAQVEARRLLDATEAALAEDGAALLCAAEQAGIRALCHGVAEELETGTSADLSALHQAMNRLNEATQEFAGRRMNASIRKMFAGHRLEDFAGAVPLQPLSTPS